MVCSNKIGKEGNHILFTEWMPKFVLFIYFCLFFELHVLLCNAKGITLQNICIYGYANGAFTRKIKC